MTQSTLDPHLKTIRDGVLAVSGEIDIFTAPRLEKRLESACGESAGSVGLDLSRVSFIDSCGLMTLRSFAQRLQKQGRDLELVGASPQVKRLLHLMPR